MLIWVKMLTVLSWSLPPQPCQRFSSPRKILICKCFRENKLKHQRDCTATFFFTWPPSSHVQSLNLAGLIIPNV